MSESTLPPLLPRERRLEALAERDLDVLVVGGGITGAGVAHDLALRGLRVAVIERGDWAGATSSASSRLVHGGLRYLENLEFRLVRDSCLERGLLLSNAAGLVWPERFCLPLHRRDGLGLAKLAAGLGLYTLVSVPRVLGLPRLLSRSGVERLVPGIEREGLRGGGLYLDGATDDSRLTLAVVTTAMEDGALALSRCEVTAIEDGTHGVEVEVRDLLGGTSLSVRPRAVVLAGGPATDSLRRLASLEGGWIEPTRGSHVLVPRERLSTDGAVLFHSAVDGRVMFLIPWPRYTVIGTTDLETTPDEPVRATHAEVRYLLDSANALVPAAGLTEEDVVSTWAGLRPLLRATGQDPSERSREERIEREGNVWTIGGGKLTGYRSMAEGLGARLAEALDQGSSSKESPTRRRHLRGALGRPAARPAWSSLGADGRPGTGRKPLVQAWQRRYAGLTTLVEDFCRARPGGTQELDPETLAGEVDWAVEHEDCLTAVDFYLRRTDLGHGPEGQREATRTRVLDRLARLLGWSPDTRAAQEGALEKALAGARAWRDVRSARSA